MHPADHDPGPARLPALRRRRGGRDLRGVPAGAGGGARHAPLAVPGFHADNALVEKLKSLPDAERFLKPGVIFAELDKVAYAKTGRRRTYATGYPPGTSAGSVRPTRRQPTPSSHLPACATSRTRPGSAYRPRGGDRPCQPSNHSPELAPSSTMGGVRRRRCQWCLRMFRRTYARAWRTSVGCPLHHVVVALLQHRAPPAEHPVRGPREARAEALHAVRQAFPAVRLHQEVRVVVLGSSSAPPGTRAASTPDSVT